MHPDEFPSFRSDYLKELWSEYFTLSIYDPRIDYEKSGTIFVKSVLSFNTWAEELHQRGYKVALDNLWEAAAESELYVVQNKNWFWYNESFWYESLGYKNYIPNKTYKKLAFMPMNIVKQHRDHILTKLNNLEDFIYSYRDKKLPNDIDKTAIEWQRYFNPEWYDDTYFSLVVETSIDDIGFITEKTFKPCAYRHPFLIYGAPDTLSHLRQLGFETYENLFDETYDSIRNPIQRLEKIIDNVNSFSKVPYDLTTELKLEHNHNLFFNKQLVTNRIVTEIIEPLIEYAET